MSGLHKEKPNILWLMTDEQRTDSLGCYGSEWAQTPNLDKLAEDGVVFSKAVTSAPVCVPARVSMLTGKYPHNTKVWWNDHKHNQHLGHLTSLFQQAGYRTATFGKQHYLSPNRAFETEEQLVCSEAVGCLNYKKHYSEKEYNVLKYPPKPYSWIFGGRFPESAEKKSEAQDVRLAISWLEQHPADKPFLLRVSFNGPHTPVVPPAPFDRLIDPDKIHIPEGTEGWSKNCPKWLLNSLGEMAKSSRLSSEQIHEMRRYYYGEVAFLDNQFGILLDWMRERKLLDNTIIVFVSDHGTHLGDFGLVQKQTFYEPTVCVPFFFWYPRIVSQGITLETPVQTMSLLPTLLDLTGIPVPKQCDAISLCDSVTTGKEPVSNPVFSEFTLGTFGIRHNDRMVMVRDGNWKFSLCMDPEPFDGALYNLDNDPYEHENLYGRQEVKDIEKKLTDLITQHLK